jgi:hypothetical protein
VTQSGVLRTNCIDCLDRTNVAQARAPSPRPAQPASAYAGVVLFPPESEFFSDAVCVL